MKTNSLAECLCQYPTKGSLAPMTELLIKIYTNIKIEHLSTLSVMLQTLSESFLYWQRICCTLSFFLHVDGCFYCGTVPPFTASPPSQKTSSKNQKKYSVLEASKEVSERGMKEASPTLSIQQSLSCSDILSKWAPK